ncbi:MAG: MazG nucleotide pyrophosphohydrolase domain-containing protein [Promethearchaeia archaeon]
MELEEAQDMMRQIYFKRDCKRGLNHALLRAFEELAELNNAIIQEKRRDLVMDELADVLAWICSLANLLDIDLAEALHTKYSGVCSKCGRSPCICP